jgi:hypothetical protein
MDLILPFIAVFIWNLRAVAKCHLQMGEVDLAEQFVFQAESLENGITLSQYVMH